MPGPLPKEQNESLRRHIRTVHEQLFVPLYISVDASPFMLMIISTTEQAMRTQTPDYDAWLLEGSEPQGSAYPDCESCEMAARCESGTEDFVSLARVVRRARSVRR